MGLGGQLLSSLGMVAGVMGKGVPLMVSTFLRDQLGGGVVKKGPFLLAHAASSLLQKSCFRKTLEAPGETKIGQAWP